MQKKSDGEIAMEKALKKRKIKYEREYVFAPPRRWRHDFFLPQHNIAIEIQGGIFIRGRHTRGRYLLKEYEKLNAAAAKGIRVFYAVYKGKEVDIDIVADLIKAEKKPAPKRRGGLRKVKPV